MKLTAVAVSITHVIFAACGIARRRSIVLFARYMIDRVLILTLEGEQCCWQKRLVNYSCWNAYYTRVSCLGWMES
jgi:hypothetical protein